MASAAAYLRLLTSAVFMSAVLAAPGGAQETAPTLLLELNAAQPSDKGCRLTFVVTNNLDGDLDRAAFELALFNAEGIVDRLTVLEFRDMPNGKTKVSRFDLAGTDCGKVSRVLVNHATDCVGTGIEPAACMRGLKTSTKGGIAFGV
ncbi:MAG TPA: hypothetical protein VMF90_24710 [Rhizobiaceae bacterium]|nr:hypothetical protein [Rhizobiaceae bacterium]